MRKGTEGRRWEWLRGVQGVRVVQGGGARIQEPGGTGNYLVFILTVIQGVNEGWLLINKFDWFYGTRITQRLQTPGFWLLAPSRARPRRVRRWNRHGLLCESEFRTRSRRCIAPVGAGVRCRVRRCWTSRLQSQICPDQMGLR